MFANYSDEMKEYGQAFESRCDDVYVIILDLIWFDLSKNASLHSTIYLLYPYFPTLTINEIVEPYQMLYWNQNTVYKPGLHLPRCQI